MTDQKPEKRTQFQEIVTKRAKILTSADYKTVTCKVKQRFSVTIVYNKMYQVHIFKSNYF